MAATADGVRGRRSAWLAVAAAAGLALAYLVLVRTTVGQRLDGTALEHRFAVTEGATRRMDGLLEAIAARSVLWCSGVLVLVALVRRRLVLAAGVVVALAGSAVTARALKDHVLTRTDLGGFGGVSYNTFPSGHATVGMALALALVLVAPPRLAWGATVLAGVAAPTVGVAVVATGGHRPSDAAGAYLATSVWFAAAAAAVRWLDRPQGRSGRSALDAARTSHLLAAAGVSLVVLTAFLVRSLAGPGRRADVSAGPYVTGVVCLSVLGVGLVTALAVVQHGSGRRPPGRRGFRTAGAGYPLVMTNSNMDDAKGRAKEALGALTDDEKLKREGQTDQKVGKVKDAIDDVADKARAGADKLRDKIDRG